MTPLLDNSRARQPLNMYFVVCQLMQEMYSVIQNILSTNYIDHVLYVVIEIHNRKICMKFIEFI